MICREAVYHKIDSDYAYPLAYGILLVRLRVARDNVPSLTVLWVDKYLFLSGEAALSRTAMTKVATDELFDYYEAQLPHQATSLAYCFYLESKSESLYYGNAQFFVSLFASSGVNYTPYMFIMPQLNHDEIINLPSWHTSSVVYQIFPDSFAPQGGDWAHPCSTQEGVSARPFGGTLRALNGRLDYLTELGIDVIFLNPIFKAASYHKYDTIDHFAIDEQFGTEEDLVHLVRSAHGRGMRVVLDGVFSATGVDFFAFADLRQQGEASRYRAWYEVKDFPVRIETPPNYRTFGTCKALPKLNFADEEVCRYCCDVLTHWVRKADIDGWRLDVADEIPHSFWRRARRELNTVKSGVLLIGEVWYDSSTWLAADQLDSVMNYLFYTAVVGFFTGDRLTPSQFADRLGALVATYRRPTLPGLWNLLDSHDTARFLHETGGDEARFKAAVSFQFTFPGVPMIYYGDEVGMTGAHDPHCRGAMVWDTERQNLEIKNHYRKLIAARRKSAALRHGSFRVLHADDARGLFAFERALADETVQIFLNASSSPLVVKFDHDGEDLLEGGATSRQREMAPWEVCVVSN